MYVILYYKIKQNCRDGYYTGIHIVLFCTKLGPRRKKEQFVFALFLDILQYNLTTNILSKAIFSIARGHERYTLCSYTRYFGRYIQRSWWPRIRRVCRWKDLSSGRSARDDRARGDHPVYNIICVGTTAGKGQRSREIDTLRISPWRQVRYGIRNEQKYKNDYYFIRTGLK